MMRYEITGVIPVCIKCGTHIPQGLPYYYIDNRGPLCRACHDELMMKEHIRGGDNG